MNDLKRRTTGPWAMKGPSKFIPGISDGGDYAIIDSAGEIIAETIFKVGQNNFRAAEANARFILNACNNYDELVEALRKIVLEGDCTRPEEMKRIARLALAKLPRE